MPTRSSFAPSLCFAGTRHSPTSSTPPEMPFRRHLPPPRSPPRRRTLRCRCLAAFPSRPTCLTAAPAPLTASTQGGPLLLRYLRCLVATCRGVAWGLRPDAWHLGSRMRWKRSAGAPAVRQEAPRSSSTTTTPHLLEPALTDLMHPKSLSPASTGWCRSVSRVCMLGSSHWSGVSTAVVSLVWSELLI